MISYLTEPRDRTFVNGYGFLSFTKNLGKNLDKNCRSNGQFNW